jgi:hypothetical protein
VLHSDLAAALRLTRSYPTCSTPWLSDMLAAGRPGETHQVTTVEQNSVNAFWKAMDQIVPDLAWYQLNIRGMK